MDYNKLRALLRGGAQGASLRFADEIAGGLGAAKEAITGDKPLTDAYTQSRDEYRKNDLTAKEAAPAWYTGGELGGGLAGAVAMPGGALKAPSISKALMQAAGYGGAYGLGSSVANNAQDMALDTAKGAALGAAVAPVAKVAGGLVGLAPKALPQSGKPTTAIGSELGEIAAQMKYAPETDAANRISKAVARRLRGDAEEKYAREIAARKASGLVDDSSTINIDDNTNQILQGLKALGRN